MRASTFFFLALFAAMVWSGRLRCSVLRGVHNACDALPACCDAPTARGRPKRQQPDPRVTAVEQELRGVDQRSRDVERSLQSIGQSERSLRELKGRLEARRVVLQAKLEMARAGLPDEIDGEAEGRVSPVDALSAAALPVREY